MGRHAKRAKRRKIRSKDGETVKTDLTDTSQDTSRSGTSDESSMADPPTPDAKSTPLRTQPAGSTEPLDYQSMMLQLNKQFTEASIPPQLMTLMTAVTQKLDSVMETNSTIMARLGKLDEMNTALTNINSKVQKVDSRVCSLEKDMHGVNVTLSDLEKSANFNSESMDTTKKTCQNMESEVRELRGAIRGLEREKVKTQEEMLDIRARSMRDNLLFFGVNEQENEIPMDTVIDFCVNKLGITDAKESIRLDRVHRIGQRRAQKTRPLVAKFCFYQQRETVRKLGYKLKGTPYGMSEQLPREMQERRKQLMPAYYEAKRRGKNAVLVRDKLFIDGREFVRGSIGDGQSNNNNR